MWPAEAHMMLFLFIQAITFMTASTFSFETGFPFRSGMAKECESAQVAGWSNRVGIWIAPQSKPSLLFLARSTMVGTSQTPLIWKAALPEVKSAIEAGYSVSFGA